jgi:hypothetical protein
MDGRMKKLLMGSVPAICGAVAASASGEKINWAERPSARESFQAATQAAATATRPGAAVIGPVAPRGGGGIGGARR